jgi:DNA-binding PadR family transcriptional regulator
VYRGTIYRMAIQRGSGDPALLILVSLSDGPKHGYAITRDVEEQVGVRLGPGTLYGALSKLVERGLIAPLPSDDRRRPYEITAAGRAVLADELASWSKVVGVGRARLGWT